MLKRRIMAPGPTEIPPTVLSVASLPIIHHRTSEFRHILGEVCLNSKSIFLTEQPILLLGASGTGGMEACIANLSEPSEKILVISGGVFGERWAQIGEALGRTVIRIETPWGQAVNVESVKTSLDQHKDCVLVCGTLSETSTGVEHPIQELAAIVAKTSALFAVDVVSGLGAAIFKMDAWGVDAAVACSHKGLMVPPGIALIALSEKAQHAVKSKQGHTFYWSFDLALKSLRAEALPDTPWTPNISLIMQLNESLKLMLAEGIENIWERHRLLAEATRRGIQSMGLTLFAPQSPSQAVTAICCPEGIKSSQIVHKMIDEWGISLVGGQSKLKSQIFRIGHLGYCDRADILMTIAVLETVLLELHVSIQRGEGVKAVQDVFIQAGGCDVQNSCNGKD